MARLTDTGDDPQSLTALVRRHGRGSSGHCAAGQVCRNRQVPSQFGDPSGINQDGATIRSLSQGVANGFISRVPPVQGGEGQGARCPGGGLLIPHHPIKVTEGACRVPEIS